MAKYPDVSLSVIRRLPRYYRYLERLMSKDVERISSREFADVIGLTASQIRQDLNCFGGFGQQGYGYNVKKLHDEIADILCIKKLKPTIIIGAGNLGLALANYMSFEELGFEVIAIFDNDPKKIGSKLGNIVVEDIENLDDFCAKNHPEVAVLCVPDNGVAKLVGKLVDNNIKGFWNFSHYDIKLNYPDKNIVAENVSLGDSIMTLGFLVSEL